jgi:hypothetical protein
MTSRKSPIAIALPSRYACIRINQNGKEKTVENIEKVKDRIAKLLRMAKDSGSPNEAAIAASRARSLMDKYQTFGEERATRTYTAIPTYMNTLSVAVAFLNDCNVSIKWDDAAAPTGNQPRGRRFIIFRGYSNDSALALAMFKSLIACIDALCKSHLVSNGYAGRYPRDIGEAFKIACAREVVARIQAIAFERNAMAEAAQASAPGTGLAIIKKRESVDAKFGEQKTKAIKIRSSYDEATTKAREGKIMEIQPKLNPNDTQRIA